jgi:hypothetical protein
MEIRSINEKGWLFFKTNDLMSFGIWISVVFFQSTFLNKSLWVGLLSVITSFGQLSSYGARLMSEWVKKVFGN